MVIGENTIEMMYVVSHFFVENVTYVNFSHILYTRGMKIFNYVHAMVLYYRELEMRVMIVEESVVDQLLMMQKQIVK